MIPVIGTASAWVPYRRLIFYTYRKQSDAASGFMAPSKLYEKARIAADALVVSSFNPNWIDPKYVWAKVTPKTTIRRGVDLRPQLTHFLTRPDSLSRHALDKLLLAHFAVGYDFTEAVARAYQDYCLVDDNVAPLTIKDVAHYASFFWDFSDAEDIEGQRDYMRRFFFDTTEYDIFTGRMSMEEVYIDLGILKESTLERHLKQIIQAACAATVKINRIVNKELRSGNMAKESVKYRDVAAFTATTLAGIKYSQESSSADSGAQDLKSLMKEVQEAGHVSSIRVDWQETASDETPEDLMRENAGGSLEKPDLDDVRL